MNFLGSFGLFSGPATDPYFSSVILLLHGDSSTDMSSYGHTASVGAGVTFDSSAANGTVGTTSIRTNGSGAANWSYGTPATEWRHDPIFTLEWWIYFDSQAANWVPLSATDFSRFMQYVGGTGSNLNAQGKYGGAGVGGSLATGAWHWFVVVSDGTDAACFIDGSQVVTLGISSADGADKSFEVLDLTANNPDYRFMEIRYTKGIARYVPTDSTISMQSAPWPDS